MLCCISEMNIVYIMLCVFALCVDNNNGGRCFLSPHPSVEYRCKNINVSSPAAFRVCSKFEPEGSVVSPRCRTPVYSEKDFPDMRCKNSKWNHVAKCVLDCGTVTSKATELVAGGVSVSRAEIPWHAGIYTKTYIPYMQLCGGSLISSNIVLSAAHCFPLNENNEINSSDYAVAAGKLYRPWDDKMDEGQQYSDVEKLHFPDHFQGSISNFQADIAVVIVKIHFQFNWFMKPVCLDFDDRFEQIQLDPENKGKVAGWGLTKETGSESQVLKTIDLPYVTTSRCISESPFSFRPHITSDKFCAGYKNASKAVCKGDSGGGLVFSYSDKGKDRYYLRGIVSTAPTAIGTQKCNVNEYISFTRLQIYKQFVKEFWMPEEEQNVQAVTAGGRLTDENNNRMQNNGECKLPPYPNHGTYVTNVQDAMPGDSFDSIFFNVICNRGYKLIGTSPFTCLRGIWPDDFPKCIGNLSAESLSTERKNNSPQHNEACRLPPYPDHGTYVTNKPDAKPGDSFEYIYFNVTCDQGYELNGNNTAYCYNGSWPEGFPNCIGKVCDKGNNITGVCTRLPDCPPAVELIHRHGSPKLCAHGRYHPIVCCEPPPSTTSTTPSPETTSTTTEYVPPYYDYKEVMDTICDPLHSSLTPKKTGKKAWDKCIDYQENLVFPCTENLVGKSRVNRCHHNVDQLIVGGNVAKRTEFPHMVLLRYGDDNQTSDSFCGGALISENFVLTAAHCIYNKLNVTVSYAIVGTTKLIDADDGRWYRIKRTIKHPDYNPPQQYNDIGLLELAKSVPLDEFTVPACLHTGDQVYESSAIATGWEKLHNRGSKRVSSALQKVVLTKFESIECSFKYPPSNNVPDGFMPASQTCFGDRVGNVNMTCLGDGLLQVKSKKIACMYHIIGVTSIGNKCGLRDEPGLYTRVDHYVDWIENIVWPN